MNEKTLDEWVEGINGKNGAAIREFLSDASVRECVEHAPGAEIGEYARPGGYEAMLLKGFAESDGSDVALTEVFLADIEKPFVYDVAADGSVTVNARMSEESRRVFRERIVKKYKFEA